MTGDPTATRRVLVLAHTGRSEARDVARAFVHGAERPRHRGAAAGRGGRRPRPERGRRPTLGWRSPTGSQTPRRAASWPSSSAATAPSCAPPRSPTPAATPVLGVNLGHVGFLAEAEYDDVDDHDRGDRRPPLHHRGPAHPRRHRPPDGELVDETFALNEASVEKAARERMLEVVVEIDGRPLSRWGCDGVVCATPTGSTAYNFSAGGPVVWPSVEALCVVPLSAHALFARPMVVAPTSVRRDRGARAQRRCRRAVVRRPPHRRPAARRPDRGAPRRPRRSGWSGCTRRRSPIGWWPSSACRSRAGAGPSDAPPTSRGPAMLEEIRIRSLGVIDASALELGPGPDRHHRRDRRRQDHGRDRARPAARRPGRQRRGPHRRQARPGSRASSRSATWPASPPPSTRPGERSRTHGWCSARTVSAEGRSRAFVGGASVPVSRLADLAEPLVAVHGQSDQHRLLQPRAQREALDRFAGDAVAELLARYRASTTALRPTERELDDVTTHARDRAREADLLRFGLEEIEAVAPQPGEDADAGRRGGPARARRHAAAPPPSRPATACPATTTSRTRSARVAAARTALDSVRDHDPEAGALADRLAELTYLLSDLAADLASYASSVETDPARLAAVPERRAALTALTRKYGDTIDEVLAWAERSAAAAARPRRHRRADRDAARRAGCGSRPSSTTWPTAVRRPHRGRRPAGRGHRRAGPARDADARLDRGRQHEAGRRGVAVERDAASAARGVDEVELLLAANVGAEPRPLAQGRLRWRAVPGDAGAGGGPRRHRTGADVRLRRGRRRRRRRGRGRGRPAAGPAGPHAPRSSWSPTCRRSRPTPTGTSWSRSPRRHRDQRRADRARRRAPGAELSRMLAGLATPTPRSHTPGSCSRPPSRRGPRR